MYAGDRRIGRKLPLRMHNELIEFSAIMKRWRKHNEGVQVQ